MKVQLINDIPIEIKHGMTKGKIFEVDKEFPATELSAGGLWLLGDAGEEVKIFTYEYDIISNQ